MKTIGLMTMAVVLIAASAGQQVIAQPASAASNVASGAASDKAARAENRLLAKRVLKALARTRGLDSTGLFVKAVNGNVVLTGAVPDASQIPLAVESARRVDAVKTVRDDIRLQDRPY